MSAPGVRVQVAGRGRYSERPSERPLPSAQDMLWFTVKLGQRSYQGHMLENDDRAMYKLTVQSTRKDMMAKKCLLWCTHPVVHGPLQVPLPSSPAPEQVPPTK